MEISSHAKELQNASDAVTKTRQEKIAQLKADIESGTYKIDSNSIAENIVNFYKKAIKKEKANVSKANY